MCPKGDGAWTTRREFPPPNPVLTLMGAIALLCNNGLATLAALIENPGRKNSSLLLLFPHNVEV
jgi:hypothetical protein